MPFITWDDCYSVQIDEFDDEHKQIVNIINQLDTAIREENDYNNAGNIINQLIEYSKTHFVHEEKFMEEIGYPELEKHKRLHVAFTDEANQFHDKFYSGQSIPTEQLMEFLWNWLLDHIMSADKKYGLYYNENNQKVGQNL